ncbi:shikimate dehydrogenase family protein [Paraburkholderia bryophila]|jgi:shikimate dehydrogenase|uniref:Shikimate dehydrogenase n=1 Tax=Paraburkholderia bryophila TaxID=420952 RepID=A0A329CJT4_9BURK|nr:shikimate dehydrogenase [Paraburkholderia bryophila]RAS34337.1 shikimate dehydrogenase [Paraburkholderia bryophila]
MQQKLDGTTRLFPIIGDPIKFVKSPQQLTLGFEARGHNAVCLPMQVAKDDLETVMHALTLTGNVDGLLVTMPHKFSAFAYCQTSSDTARLIGGVSVMRRNADGTWHGDMLDGLAFVKAQIDHGARVEDGRALLLGAGAAGSAIAIALLNAGLGELVIHDADESRATRLVDRVAELGRGRIRLGAADPAGCTLVFNATPMGLAENDPLPVSGGLLDSSMFVGDVIAGHGLTPLLKAAQSVGCKTANGAQMVDAVQEMMLDFLLGQDANSLPQPTAASTSRRQRDPAHRTG